MSLLIFVIKKIFLGKITNILVMHYFLYYKKISGKIYWRIDNL